MILRYLCLFIVVVGIAQSATLDNIAWQDKCAALSRFPCLQNNEKWESGPPCIAYSQLCNGENDCADGRDERPQICGPSDGHVALNLPKLSTPAPEDWCGNGFFKCHNNTLKDQFIGVVHSAFCIPARWRCDGEMDCLDESDEKDCDTIACNEHQFQCTSKDNPDREICISKSWQCDGEEDCKDGVDEKDCATMSPLFPSLANLTNLRPIFSRDCGDDEFKCGNGVCIYTSWKCDGHDDCGDNSDENKSTCPDRNNTCSADQFACVDNNYCVPSAWRCDGQHDCLDGSDERQCEHYDRDALYNLQAKHNTSNKCASEHEWACPSGECILQVWLCDNENDCPGGEDEEPKLCEQRKKDGKAPQYSPQEHTVRKTCDAKIEFQCVGSGECINLHLVCDGKDDCKDASDESHTICVSNKKCKSDEFDCYGNGMRCLNRSQACDGTMDCLFPMGKQAADEEPTLCSKGPGRDKDGKRDCDKDNGGCEQLCIAENKGYCQCKNGFKLVDGHKCVDINECEKTYGLCSQICTNIEGNYTCSCHKDYVLQSDGRSCKAKGDDPLLLLANREHIRQVDLRTKQFERLVDNLTSAIAVDYHMGNQTIVWTDVHHEKIYKCNLKNRSAPKSQLLKSLNSEDVKNCRQVLAEDRVMTPDGIAVDWIHDLVFWTDTGYDTINVLDLNAPKNRRVLFDKNLKEPRAIAVDPKLGLIFWTDWGDEAKIERAGMNGEGRETIVDTDLTWPNGLALDLLEQRVYWADAKLKRIESCKYDGSDRKVIMQSANILHHPFSISVFEDKMYWTDWDTEGVHTANKFNGRDHDLLIHGSFGIMSIRIWHTQTQPPLPNLCKDETCAHLCLPRAGYNSRDAGAWSGNAKKRTSYDCQCADGFERLNNGLRCKNSKTNDVDETGVVNVATNILKIGEAELEELENGIINSGSGSTVFALFVAIVIILAVIGFMYYRRNSLRSAFRNIPVNFDNPIYRTTTTQDDERVFFDEPPGPGPELSSTNEYRDEPPTQMDPMGTVVIGHRPFDQGRANLTADFE